MIMDLWSKEKGKPESRELSKYLLSTSYVYLCPSRCAGWGGHCQTVTWDSLWIAEWGQGRDQVVKDRTGNK